jgi:hypothetical protein
MNQHVHICVFCFFYNFAAVYLRFFYGEHSPRKDTGMIEAKKFLSRGQKLASSDSFGLPFGMGGVHPLERNGKSDILVEHVVYSYPNGFPVTEEVEQTQTEFGSLLPVLSTNHNGGSHGTKS